VFAAAYRLGIHDVILTSADPERFFNKIRNLVFVHQKIIHLENTIENLNKKMSSMQYEDILGMCRMAEARDGFLGGHLDRVGHYSAKIAKNMGIGDHECMMFNCASKLHDIGKVGIPDHILNKPGKLTQEEFETVKTHSVRGFEIVRGCQQNVLLDQAKEVILYHHESWDGSGYPYGLRGDEIPPLARIVKVVDVFDALMSKRAYKEPWDFDTAVDYLRKNCNVQFEPAIVDIFLGLVSKSDFD
jgi:putative two-component system response regulator